jgi:hypothetical protein
MLLPEKDLQTYDQKTITRSKRQLYLVLIGFIFKPKVLSTLETCIFQQDVQNIWRNFVKKESSVVLIMTW